MNTLRKTFIFIFLAPLLFGCNGTTITAEIDTTSEKDYVISLLKETRTTQYFSDENVPLEDITTILDAGRNAASGRNMQPWFFGSIINQEIIAEIAGSMTMGGPPPGVAGAPGDGAPMLPASSTDYPKAGFGDSPAAIAVACTENNEFSIGLACQNMIIAANALDYGAKIVMGGADQLNNEKNRALLQIPDDMNVMAILMVGKTDTSIDITSDGVTGASERKPLDEVSFVVQ